MLRNAVILLPGILITRNLVGGQNFYFISIYGLLAVLFILITQLNDLSVFH